MTGCFASFTAFKMQHLSDFRAQGQSLNEKRFDNLEVAFFVLEIDCIISAAFYCNASMATNPFVSHLIFFNGPSRPIFGFTYVLFTPFKCTLKIQRRYPLDSNPGDTGWQVQTDPLSHGHQSIWFELIFVVVKSSQIFFTMITYFCRYRAELIKKIRLLSVHN